MAPQRCARPSGYPQLWHWWGLAGARGCGKGWTSCPLPSPSSLQVSHDFAINFNPDNDECEGESSSRGAGSTAGTPLTPRTPHRHPGRRGVLPELPAQNPALRPHQRGSHHLQGGSRGGRRGADQGGVGGSRCPPGRGWAETLHTRDTRGCSGAGPAAGSGRAAPEHPCPPSNTSSC